MEQVVVHQGQKLKQLIKPWTADLHLMYTLPYTSFISKLLKEKFEDKLSGTQPAFIEQWARQYGSASDVKWCVCARAGTSTCVRVAVLYTLACSRIWASVCVFSPLIVLSRHALFINRTKGDREPPFITTNNGLEAINKVIKALIAEGDGRRLPLIQALQQMLTAMRTLSQQRASKPAPLNPCQDLGGMTPHADAKYV